MEYTPEQIENRLNSLPADIKQAMSEVDTTTAILNVGKKNGLHVDQMGELLYCVGLVMLGLEHSQRFADIIIEKVGVSPEQAEVITADINNEVFLKLRESIKKIHEQHSSQNTEIDNRPLAEKMNPFEQKHEGEVLDKDKILAEIENPENIIENKVSTPSVNINVQIPVIEPPMPAEPFKMNIMESKLGGVTKLPMQEKKVEESGVKIDPYREPIE
ncbi:TPA: hypothetical protein DCZ46_01210 [Candidatus Campbellbacteria bacterium]|nr:MAG: seg [Candidatus Campbellbacteria bacterium GW2011_OD1_34_28]KKP75296.1 MAG: hypothetical protein UR74_C0001G0152 [Candidatus Campbellbacteria bacterium GW2011_GWD2_35_24]KKP76143.1 MAG: hypothetical protein UR75_C0001G0177 [Candidatus Campbellbacteria bacterium GW2011_GWC2_35_28]KKP77332.1 MAG: hypothetical protein UR76_C0001G0177 [Candidatus Campbellbacteria bacterium GW2011_GWC1_35_31]KKP79261.1 MAG: hypothetical protein UR79_C0001G0177 [Candidatus Campbellbacteria bacterium GW2011_GW